MEDAFATGKRSVHTRGDIIDVENKIHFVKSGAIGLFTVEQKKRSMLFFFKQGEIFPYVKQQAGLTSGRKLEYRTLHATSLLTLSKNEFLKKAYEPENLKFFVGDLMESVQLQIERLDNMSGSSAYQRLIERLNFFVERLGVINGDQAIIDLPMSHADIAGSIGTTRETVNRYMKQLESSGLLNVKNQMIVINSVSSLKSMVDTNIDPPSDRSRFLLTAAAAVAVIGEIVKAID